MDEGRKDYLQMIQGIIDRMAQNSFQLKGWTVTLAAVLEVFLKGEARPAWLLCLRCRSLPSGCSMPGIFAANGSSGAYLITCEQETGRRISRWMSVLSPAKSGQCSQLPCHRPLSAFTVRCCWWRLPSQ
jgi:hypothetical protein